jgi:nitroimidazol reductase NimA-like FMN-containing flavoprotein (pyridoxamine 5'-phosphate oxidase superfamily)
MSDSYNEAIDTVDPATESLRGRPASERVKVRRRPARANYQRDVIDKVFDDSLVCHVGFVMDGQPYVLPQLHVRIGDELYLHGDKRNGMLAQLVGTSVCIEATTIDRLMWGRSAFQNSVNYRSAVALGVGRLVDDPDEKVRALWTLVNRILPPDRVPTVRPLSDEEIDRTMVVAIPLTEASAKIRTGGSVDAPGDLDAPVWAGEIPVHTVLGTPIPDDKVLPGVEVPDYLDGWTGPPVKA